MDEPSAPPENVLIFPEKVDGVQPPPTSFEAIRERVANMKMAFVVAVVEQVSEKIVTQLDAAGLGISERVDTDKDYALATEALVSLVLKTQNVHHPLQDYAESIFEEKADGFIYMKDEETL